MVPHHSQLEAHTPPTTQGQRLLGGAPHLLVANTYNFEVHTKQTMRTRCHIGGASSLLVAFADPLSKISMLTEDFVFRVRGAREDILVNYWYAFILKFHAYSDEEDQLLHG